MDEHAAEEPLFVESDTIAEPLDQPTVDDAQPFGARASVETELLVQEGIVIVRPLAHKVARQVGRVTDVDELVSVGQTALFDAARSYDPAKSPFLPYASNRIRWAMIDSVRRQTHGRSAAARARALVALDQLDEAAPPRVSATLETEATYQARLKAVLATEACALFMGLASAGAEALATEPADTPEEALIRNRAGAALRAAIGTLEGRHREIVERYYFGGERFDHIAESMGVSKSWLSRLHAQALEALGQKLRED